MLGWEGIWTCWQPSLTHRMQKNWAQSLRGDFRNQPNIFQFRLWIAAPFMAPSMIFINGDVRCKKCEPEQKTASESVDADRRGSHASVKKINSNKNPSWWQLFWRRVNKNDTYYVRSEMNFFSGRKIGKSRTKYTLQHIVWKQFSRGIQILDLKLCVKKILTTKSKKVPTAIIIVTTETMIMTTETTIVTRKVTTVPNCDYRSWLWPQRPRAWPQRPPAWPQRLRSWPPSP